MDWILVFFVAIWLSLLAYGVRDTTVRHAEAVGAGRRKTTRERKKAAYEVILKAKRARKVRNRREANRRRQARRRAQQPEDAQRLADAKSSPFRIAVDCQYTERLDRIERSSLVRQLGNVWSVQRESAYKASLHLCSVRGDLEQRLESCGAPQWQVHRHGEDVEEVFPPSSLVFLSPDAETELDQLNDSDIYVVGGIVDRTVCTGLSQARAERMGARCARLPLERHCGRIAKPVLNVDTVVDILLRARGMGDWKAALEAALPRRNAVAKERGCTPLPSSHQEACGWSERKAAATTALQHAWRLCQALEAPEPEYTVVGVNGVNNARRAAGEAPLMPSQAGDADRLPHSPWRQDLRWKPFGYVARCTLRLGRPTRPRSLPELGGLARCDAEGTFVAEMWSSKAKGAEARAAACALAAAVMEVGEEVRAVLRSLGREDV